MDGHNQTTIWQLVWLVNDNGSRLLVVINYTLLNSIAKIGKALKIAASDMSVKLSRFYIGHTRLTYRHLI